MDQSRLDHLTRFVARRTGRRTLASGALGGLLASLLPGLGATDAAAKKKLRKKTPRCKKPTHRCGKKCVNVKKHSRHCGKCNRKCKLGYVCRQGRCLPLACGQGGPCRVFVTKDSFYGGLSGVLGADAACTFLAGLAGAPGVYQAWLSDSVSSPSTRFTNKNSGPYELMNGALIAKNWTDLTDGKLAAPINLTEEAKPVPDNPEVWTNTLPNGTAHGTDHCNYWSLSQPGAYHAKGVGVTLESSSAWTNAYSSVQIQCNFACHLYCFQQS